MKPDVFAEKMKNIENDYRGDPEAMHSKADDLLIRVLRDLGYEKGCDIFEQMDLWYA